MPWKGGLIVTTAPEILYLKDTNGDGKADIRQELYRDACSGPDCMGVEGPESV
jgi:hypothetical protein